MISDQNTQKRRAGGHYKTSRDLPAEEMTGIMLASLEKRKRQVRLQGGGAQIRSAEGLVNPFMPIPVYRLKPLMERLDQFGKIIGGKPAGWQKPAYGDIDYFIAHRMGWISDEEEGRDRLAYEARRERSLRTGHRYSEKIFRLPDNPAPEMSGGYVPEVSAGVLNDKHLTDGARRLAMRLMEECYRVNRAGRCLKTTVPYLVNSLGRCRRTIQNYLGLLERLGYIERYVIKSERTRMSIGLVIQLLKPLFPRHHRKKWPKKCEISGAQENSQNYWLDYNNIENLMLVPVRLWAQKCMDGIFRSLMRNKSALEPPNF